MLSPIPAPKSNTPNLNDYSYGSTPLDVSNLNSGGLTWDSGSAPSWASTGGSNTSSTAPPPAVAKTPAADTTGQINANALAEVNKLINTKLFEPPPRPNIQTGISDAEQAELDKSYAGADTALLTQLKNLQAQLPISLQGLSTEEENLIAPYELKLKQGLRSAEEQTATAAEEEQTSQSELRQLANQLAQYAKAKYGGMSTAGTGALELLGREVAKQFGGITKTAAANRQKILDYKTDLQDTVFTAEQSIKKAIAQKKDEVQQWFTEKIDAVNTNRAMTEAQKAQTRYQIITQRTQLANDIETQAWQYQTQVATWYQQKQVEFAAALSGINTGGANVENVLAQLGLSSLQSNVGINTPGVEGEVRKVGNTYYKWTTASGKGVWEETIPPVS